MSAHNVNLRIVLSDTGHIINANRGHFLALSLIFVLPLPFSAIVFPSFSKPTSSISSYSRFLSSSLTPLPEDEIPPSVDKSDIIFTVICSLFQLMFSFFSTASITRSILNGFFGEPLKFTSSIKSIMVSFLPLTGTHIVLGLLLLLMFFVVSVLAGFMYVGILLSGAETDFGNALFLGLVILLVVLLMGVCIYFQLEWYLADVIVVVESKWGFAPLRRSSYLVKGTRSIAFLISVFYALLLGVLSSANFFSSSVPTPINSGSVSWMWVFRSTSFMVIATILRLYSVAATAVLFIYCKGLRGELVTGKADEFAMSIVQTPYDGYDYEKAHKVAV